MSNVLIEDGKGRGFKASVSSVNRLNVSSKSNPRAYYNSRDGEMYTFHSSYSASSGDVVLYIKNDNPDKNFVVTGIWLGGANAAVWEFFQASGTATGTDVTGVQLNFTSGNTAQATSKGNAAVSGTANEATIAKFRTPATASGDADFRETLILGNKDAIGIIYTGTAGAIEITVGGHFEVHGSGAN